jgi:NADPH2:quinone reductase
MSYAEAAGFFLIYQTAYFALVRQARLAPGETLLVHAGASGVGTAAIQLGKALGATVLATARGEAKLAFCRQLGADHTIDYTTGDFASAVLDITGGRGANVIFDPVGGDVFDRSTKCIAWEGRLLPIGFASGRIPKIGANRILLKSISVQGMYWSTYWQNAPQWVREAHDTLIELYLQGRIAPVIWRRYPLTQLPEALAAVVNRETRGKAVLTVTDA